MQAYIRVTRVSETMRVTRNLSSIFTRDSICYSAYMPRQFRPSVRPSVFYHLFIKTAERIIEILS